MSKRKCLPSFRFEKKLWEKGTAIVAGADEVGRGCFAGPVVAGAVVFKKNAVIANEILIDDSKKMSARQREISDVWIKRNTVWGIGNSTVSEINRLGIKKASEKAFRRAIVGLKHKLEGKDPEHLLVDAFFVPYVYGVPVGRKKVLRSGNEKVGYGKKQSAIVHGDKKSRSIAAASIIAKVYRDNLMRNLSHISRYRKYGWDKNKGYGTLVHRKAILKYGTTKYHRKTFVQTYLNKIGKNP